MTQSYSSRTNGTDYTEASSIQDQQFAASRTAQHPYYIPEQGNPGVATMNTHPNISMRQYPLAQNSLQRSMSYPPQSMPSVTSSPGAYSTLSCRSPMPHE